jgi:hypothetical protein
MSGTSLCVLFHCIKHSSLYNCTVLAYKKEHAISIFFKGVCTSYWLQPFRPAVAALGAAELAWGVTRHVKSGGSSKRQHLLRNPTRMNCALRRAHIEAACVITSV